MTHVRSVTPATCLAGLALAVSAGGWLRGAAATQGAIVDDGAFRISRAGGGGAATEVESFRISRGDNGQLVATSQLNAGARRVVTNLVTDSIGTPITYRLTVMDNKTQTSAVQAAAQAGRLATRLSNQRGDESDRDYPMGRERTVILDDELVHQLYFSGLSSRSGGIRVISPHVARAATFVIAAHGMEPIEVGGQSVTATHLSLVNGADRRDFWVDADGRVLKAETSSGLKAVRDELPRKR
jgi:hypothetical protein